LGTNRNNPMSKWLSGNSRWINRRTAFALSLLTILIIAGSVLNRQTLSRGISPKTWGLTANAGVRSKNSAPLNPCSASPVVTINADSGLGSLRTAILDACADATITFDMTQVVSPITLTSGALVIDKNLTIQGPTTASLTISGNLNSRIFNVDPGITALISSLTISNGRAAFGGGIYNQGTLTIIASTINGNASADGVDGAAASNGTNGGDGGGLYNSGTFKLINSTISGNQAGNGGNATGTGLGGNGGNGGGIYNGGTLLLTNDSISQNGAGRNGLNTNGDETNADLGTPGQGGGLFTTTTTATLRNTIIAGNLSTFFSHNHIPPGGTGTQDNDSDGAGTVDSSSSFNLIGAIEGLSGMTAGTNGNQAGAGGAPLNPLLGPLTNNGGPTLTYLPMEFSPAIDAGGNALALDQNNNALTTDQRGVPRILNGTVDIGAVETAAPPTPPPSADVSITKTGPSQAFPNSNVSFTITVTNLGPDAATSVKFDDSLPAGTPGGSPLTFVGFTQDSGPVWNCGVPSAATSCSITNLAAGTTSVFTFIGHVPAGALGVQYTNQAKLICPTMDCPEDPNTENNIASSVTNVVSCLTEQFVTTSADIGAGSLRQAIIDACDGSTISFDMTQVVSPISLTTGLLINKNLTINGPGANLLTVMRSIAGGTPNFSVFAIPSNKVVNISGLTVTNGKSDNGGGFANSGTLTLRGVTVSGNSTETGGASGGGIVNYSPDSTQQASLTIIESTISGNSAQAVVGGIYNLAQTDGTATLNILNSTVSGNSSTAGSAGGVENVATTGAGTATAVITNSTITNNTTSANAGGILNGSSGAVSTVTLRNTIVAGNFGNSGSSAGDISGTMDAASSFNLVGTGGSGGLTNGVNNNQVGVVNALMALLGNNGGPTQTHALLPGSPAINAGSNTLANNTTLTTDQRGTGFERIVNTSVDIGAFESRGFAISATSGTPQSAVFNTVFGAPLVATVSSAFSEPVDGGEVAFTAPGAGASATFTGGLNTIKITIASGQASASATANATVGGPYNVTAAGTGITGTADFSLTNIKADQTISFGAIADKTFGDADFVVSPTATSGLPVSLSASGQCTVTSPSPGTVHITAAGSCTITASQAGDANYNAATNVPRSFAIDKANQTITFNPLANKTFGDPDFSVSASASSGLTVSLAASGNCTVTGPSPGTVHITGAGSCAITASQAGDGNYNAATNVPRSFAIDKANQTITFNALANKTFGDPDFSVSASASSGLAVSFAASGNCTVTSPSPGTVHITGAGSCAITASQAGDGNYNAATYVPRSFTVDKANQTITFNALANKTFGDPDFSVSATASSGLTVSLAASGNCTVTSPSPGTVHITGAGSCAITASQAGDVNYNAAADVLRSFTIDKANQTITFNALANKTFGDPDFAVNATASSGLPVTLGASGNCTVTTPSPGTVHITGAGSCTITASQGGNIDYLAASDVVRSFTIARAVSDAAVASSVNPSDLGQSVTFTATVTSAAGTPAGTVQFKDNGNNIGAAVALNASGVAQVAASTLTVGTHTVTADYSGAVNFLTSTGTISGGQVIKPLPTLSIEDVSTTEGQAGTKVLNFTVTLSAGSNLTVTSNFATSNGTAIVGSDYVATSGTLTFNPGELTKTIPVTINGDIDFEPDETFTVTLTAPTNATLNKASGTGTIQNDDVLGGFIAFSQVNTNVNESTGIVTLTVVRTDDVSQAVNVDYATDDTGASTNCAALNTGLASQRCDYTSVFGTLKFAANETQKTIDIPINLDAYTEGPETFSVKLSNPTGGAVLAVPSTGVVTINDSASPAPNAIDDTTTFVRQQYRDFLNREADAAGLAFWKNNIDKCNDPAQRPPGQTLAACIEVQRIVSSAAFFLSIEFKQTGGMVREFYVAALDRPATNNMPDFVEFMRDAQGIQKGVVVSQGNWQEVLDANRTAFMSEFVTRAEFVALYPTADTPTQYVDKLYQHANVAPVTVQERLDAILEFGGAPTAADPGARGRALLRITRNGNFQAREANRTFVQIEYFGYLRRDPDIAGFNFWVAKLNQFNGDFLQAEMVKAFLSSPEYRGRFGP
jgi:hypothetical protein